MVGEILLIKCSRGCVANGDRTARDRNTNKNILVLKGQTNNVVRPNVPAVE